MADLTSKTLKQAQPGLLHTDNETDVSALSSSWSVVEDGDGNRSGLWLKNDRRVSIGDDSHEGGTNDYPLYVTALNTKSKLLALDDNEGNQYTFSTNPTGTIYNTLEGSTDIERNLYYRVNGGATAGSDGNIFFTVGLGGYVSGSATGVGIAVSGQDNNTKSSVAIGSTSHSTTPSTGTDIPSTLTVWGDTTFYGQIRTSTDTNIFYVDVVEGDDTNTGGSSQPLASIDEVMTRISSLSGQNVTIYLLGKDDSSTGNASDNGYTIGVDCYLHNCNLVIKGLDYEGNEFDISDGDHDLPRLHFTMNNTASARGSFGFWLNNCSVKVSNLRLITPVWTASEEKTDVGTDAMFRTSEDGFSIRMLYCRTELGDVPLIAGGQTSRVDVSLFRNRIIRSDTALTYGTVGQTGGQDNSGSAGIPVWSTDHFENVTTAYGTKGYFSNTYRGSIWVIGDTETYSGGLAGFFGAYPSNDASSYSYTDPTTNDQQNGEQTLFANRTAQYTLTTDGTTAGKLPINFKSNKVLTWYQY